MKLKKMFMVSILLTQILVIGMTIKYCFQLFPVEEAGSLTMLLISLFRLVLLAIVGYGLYCYSNSKRLPNKVRVISAVVAAVVLMLICYICNSIAILTKTFIEIASLEVCSCLLTFYMVLYERNEGNAANNEEESGN